MFEAFYWMFKQKDLKKHFIYLITRCLILIILACLILLLTLIPELSFNKNYLLIASLVVFMCTPLLLNGYLWEMTEEIIDRNLDVVSSNIYDGKIKTINVINLPDLKFRKILWRGIASVVAFIIMGLGYTLLIYGLISTGRVFEPNLILALALILYILTPGILWNYARRNSVFSLLNIFVGIHLLGTYPIKYIFNTILYFVFRIINYILDAFLIGALNLSPIIRNGDINVLTAPPIILEILILFAILFIKQVYCIYVYAHLIGTLAPVSEV